MTSFPINAVPTVPEASVVTDPDTGLDFEEGGYGNSQLTQENINLILIIMLIPYSSGNTEHVFNTGQITVIRHMRLSGMKMFTQRYHLLTVPAWDVLLSELTASKGTVNTSHQNYALYAQDTIKNR